jgi:hypothetical protein
VFIFCVQVVFHTKKKETRTILYSLMPTGSCTVALRDGHAPAFPYNLYFMTNRSPIVLYHFYFCDIVPLYSFTIVPPGYSIHVHPCSFCLLLIPSLGWFLFWVPRLNVCIAPRTRTVAPLTQSPEAPIAFDLERLHPSVINSSSIVHAQSEILLSWPL